MFLFEISRHNMQSMSFPETDLILLLHISWFSDSTIKNILYCAFLLDSFLLLKMNVTQIFQIPVRFLRGTMFLRLHSCLNVWAYFELYVHFQQISKWIMASGETGVWRVDCTDVPTQRKSVAVLDARKSPWKKPTILTMEKHSMKTYISLHISQSTVRQ